MTGSIYKYTNKINNMSYIGQTINTEQRRIEHENCLSKDKFHTALRYYGIINFEYSILESNIPEENLDERERYWIKYYDSFNNGYNSSPGGEQLRLRLPRKTRKELGLYYGGRIIYGYKLNDKKEYVIDKTQSKIIKLVFEKYCEGKTMKQISDELNMKRHASVQCILNRHCYYDGTKPKIISKTLFDKAQLMKTHNKTYYKNNTHILKGIIYDKDNNRMTTNKASSKFISKITHMTVPFSTCDLLLSHIDYSYDKIIASRTKRYIIKFDIYNNGKYVESISIHTYNNRVV